MQGELERALSVIFKRQVDTVCAGRTDAGVHALGQVVSFEVAESEIEGRSFERLRASLNALVEDGIAITAVEERKCGFSARFDAKSRTYRYFICNQPTRPVFCKMFSWHVPKSLDVDSMLKASRYLLGEHDFKSFCAACSSKDRTTSRYIESIDIDRAQIMGESIIVVEVRGNAFLHNMIRIIVGTLVKVGLGKCEPEWVLDVLRGADRRLAGETAPANGLIFWHVRY